MGEIIAANERGKESSSPIEEVRLTVPSGDDPTLPVWTFRMWSIGLLSCGVAAHGPLPRPRAAAPQVPIRMLGGGEWSLNPGPFNIKEDVLISIFANAGYAFGNGHAYAVGIVDIIRAFYRRSISFLAAWLLITTTQVLGYGWAGLLRKYVVEPANMWWPGTLVQVSLFREIYHRFRASHQEEPDIHTKLMRKYDDIPTWWFYTLTVLSMTVSLILCTVLKDQVQLPWWGLLFACGMAFVFTLPISIITATTNQTPGLNVITEYAMGLIMPGYPIANVCFKVYGYMSMLQAVAFLSDFKLGHYMKIPPRSMFIVQVTGTLVAATINLSVALWLLGSVENICQDQLLSPGSPWTCPGDRVFFDASVIWGLVGPKRIFGPHGNYEALNWFFLVGAAGPVMLYIFHRIFPSQKWILMINLPVLIGATAYMPAATAVNYNSWLLIGTIFNFFVFRYRKTWWQRYNYILSGALDAGVAFMAVLLYFTLTMENRTVDWWGTAGEHCPLASCPTAKGVDLGPDSACPVF